MYCIAPQPVPIRMRMRLSGDSQVCTGSAERAPGHTVRGCGQDDQPVFLLHPLEFEPSGFDDRSGITLLCLAALAG